MSPLPLLLVLTAWRPGISAEGSECKNEGLCSHNSKQTEQATVDDTKSMLITDGVMRGETAPVLLQGKLHAGAESVSHEEADAEKDAGQGNKSARLSICGRRRRNGEFDFSASYYVYELNTNYATSRDSSWPQGINDAKCTSQGRQFYTYMAAQQASGSNYLLSGVVQQLYVGTHFDVQCYGTLVKTQPCSCEFGQKKDDNRRRRNKYVTCGNCDGLWQCNQVNSMVKDKGYPLEQRCDGDWSQEESRAESGCELRGRDY